MRVIDTGLVHRVGNLTEDTDKARGRLSRQTRNNLAGDVENWVIVDGENLSPTLQQVTLVIGRAGSCNSTQALDTRIRVHANDTLMKNHCIRENRNSHSSRLLVVLHSEHGRDFHWDSGSCFD